MTDSLKGLENVWDGLKTGTMNNVEKSRSVSVVSWYPGFQLLNKKTGPIQKSIEKYNGKNTYNNKQHVV